MEWSLTTFPGPAEAQEKASQPVDRLLAGLATGPSRLALQQGHIPRLQGKGLNSRTQRDKPLHNGLAKQGQGKDDVGTWSPVSAARVDRLCVCVCPSQSSGWGEGEGQEGHQSGHRKSTSSNHPED